MIIVFDLESLNHLSHSQVVGNWRVDVAVVFFGGVGVRVGTVGVEPTVLNTHL